VPHPQSAGNGCIMLMPLVYDELRKLAAEKMAHEKPGQTLQEVCRLNFPKFLPRPLPDITLCYTVPDSNGLYKESLLWREL
jgi:ECF sigma factor